MSQFTKEKRVRRDKHDKCQKEFVEQLHHQNLCLKFIQAEMAYVMTVVQRFDAHLSSTL